MRELLSQQHKGLPFPRTAGHSRIWDSRGSVSSGCPGRRSRSCGRPGGQSPGCPRDPGRSGRTPCSSGSGCTFPPGSAFTQEQCHSCVLFFSEIIWFCQSRTRSHSWTRLELCFPLPAPLSLYQWLLVQSVLGYILKSKSSLLYLMSIRHVWSKKNWAWSFIEAINSILNITTKSNQRHWIC